ncbi:MAG TPA: peptidyl-prolyl cis-trans isomerase [Pyrinomonadaceae bacterium]|nr:peptidyl-prolyl cis-trans isomerase [Pyrinomonadaceae bacterium]
MALKNIPARALAFFFAALAVALAASPARAQEEGVPVVLDEPIVQVNGDVIMLSHLKRQNEEFKEVLTKQRGATPQQADEQVAQRQGEIIFNLINESLLMQKGKELPRLEEEVEAEVNREVLRVASQSGLKTLEELETALRSEGLALSDIRDTLRRQYTRQAVLQREVDAKIYYNLTDAELKKFYDANRPKFQSVTMSEIYLGLAGRSEADLLARAKELVAQARGGADFGELAVKHSEREQNGQRVAPKTKGLLEQDGKPRWFLVSDLNKQVGDAIKGLKAGGVTEPIKLEDGYLILRVNESDDAFKENFVRQMILSERSEKERETYLRALRQDAYIKPAKSYEGMILPLLEKDKTEAGKRETADKKGDK